RYSNSTFAPHTRHHRFHGDHHASIREFLQRYAGHPQDPIGQTLSRKWRAKFSNCADQISEQEGSELTPNHGAHFVCSIRPQTVSSFVPTVLEPPSMDPLSIHIPKQRSPGNWRRGG